MALEKVSNLIKMCKRIIEKLKVLDSTDFPPQLELVGLDKCDSKRLDGMTIFPFRGGRPLICNATYCNTFSKGDLVCLVASSDFIAYQTKEGKM